MSDPAMLTIATAVAAAVADKSAEALSASGKQAMSHLLDAIRTRLHRRRALEELAASPDSEPARLALAAALTEETSSDPEFRARLVDLSEAAGIEIHAAPHAVNVTNATNIGKQVVAGGDINISGGLHL